MLVERTYDIGSLEWLTGVRPLSLVSVDRLAECRVLLAGQDSCTTAVQLFLLGRRVEHAAADEGVAPLRVEQLLDAGLVELDGDDVRARVSIVPFDGLWLVGDRIDERAVPVGGRVPNTDLSTLLAASFVPRHAGGSMLDLGTGTGVHALRAARDGAAVVGVDINPRAVMYARFNAGLNGIDSAEWVEGDFFDERTEGRFDLAVANPPFIIGPDRDDVHRFGGAAGHDLAADITRTVAAHLREGGTAVVLCDLALRRGQDTTAVIADWLEGAACDAILFRLSAVSSTMYALAHHDVHAYSSSLEFETAVRRWVEYYRDRGIDSVASVAVVLRRRSGVGCGSWTEAFDLASEPVGPIGDHVSGLFEAIDVFRALQPEDLLGLHLRLVDGHELHQRLRRLDGQYVPEAVQLHLTGLPLVATVSGEGVAVLFELDGTRTAGEVIVKVAERYGVAADELRDRLVPELRRLGMCGLLMPGRPPSRPGSPPRSPQDVDVMALPAADA